MSMPLIITLNQMMIIGEEMNYLLSYLVIKIATALIIINKKKEYIMGLCTTPGLKILKTLFTSAHLRLFLRTL